MPPAPPPVLRLGDRGPAVEAMQLALHHALGAHATNRSNGVYGSRTRDDVVRFKRAHGFAPLDGSVFASRAWTAILVRNDTAAVRALLAEDAANRAEGSRTERELAAAAAIVAEMEWLLGNSQLFTYRQVRPITPYDLRDPANRGRLDCSSTVTCCYHAAGALDPNGTGYNGSGFTGTLWTHGQPTDAPKPGDLAFYGWQSGGFPKHVTLHLGNPKTVGSFGHTPPSRFNVVNYRGDYIGSRTYRLIAG
jgi:cell wall-associated NlpC family hydrolase